MKEMSEYSLQYGFGSWLYLPEQLKPAVLSVQHITIQAPTAHQWSGGVDTYLFINGSGKLEKDRVSYPIDKHDCFVGNFYDLFSFAPDAGGLEYIHICVNTAMISFIEACPYWKGGQLFPNLRFGLLHTQEQVFEDILDAGQQLLYLSSMKEPVRGSLLTGIYMELYGRLMRSFHN